MALKAKMQGREALSRRLRQLAPEAEKAAAAAKVQIAQEAAKQMAAKAPRETGDYSAHITSGLLRDNANGKPVGMNATKDPDATGVFAPFIWRFLEFGTKGHKIVAKGMRGLRFTAADGTDVVTGSVKHPGTPAQPHIFPTWRAMKPKAMRKMRNAINKAVREAMKK